MEEAEQTLRAIQYGTVDAFVVEGPEGHRVYTLEGSDLPYSTLVERMQQGAAMLDAHGCIVYCNLSLARLLGMSRETVIGQSPARISWLWRTGPSCEKLLRENRAQVERRRNVALQLADGNVICGQFLF